MQQDEHLHKLLTSRRFKRAAAAALATPVAWAQAWPAKPLRITLPYPLGGITDVTARLIGQKLQARLGQTVRVGNNRAAEVESIVRRLIGRVWSMADAAVVPQLLPSAKWPGRFRKLRRAGCRASCAQRSPPASPHRRA